ncbi:MAG TPA: hypothetical protein DCP03_19525 [Polaromonas sp.]|uniref:hypothetical protein n=1 Tax=Polaromonas sp. UBA4122 TaxID=1947074 RepID=UPI000EC13B95|nr:hypothetical protein [Polaromonas sp. UBA4122]HAL40174.1 hypothetical protein [Polaromonas sp.]
MFLKTEFISPRTYRCLLASVAVAVLAACSTSPSSKSAEVAAGRMTAPSSVAYDGTGRPSAGQPTPQANTAASPATDATLRMLAYADRVRLMLPAELSQEMTRLGEVSAPAEQLQLSLVLSQLRQLPELIRAQELLARVLGNDDAQALHPLARLLAARYGEQRRLEEQLEKQTQQVRDLQRRMDQTNERLEALKAIERSLTSRPPAASSSSPLNRARPPAP